MFMLRGNAMQLTSRTEYAVRAMIDLARLDGSQATAKEIAKRQEIPPKFLPQIMVDLSRAGLVQGTRGSGGGVRLAVDPTKVTLRRIVDAIEGPMALYACLEEGGVCHREGRCEVQHVWAWAQSRFLKALEEFTLQDLVSGAATAQVGEMQRKEGGPRRVTDITLADTPVVN
jgi:Rrf2 family transcriptional regulator, iron-sulfur cluster assembly transcription factor